MMTMGRAAAVDVAEYVRGRRALAVLLVCVVAALAACSLTKAAGCPYTLEDAVVVLPPETRSLACLRLEVENRTRERIIGAVVVCTLRIADGTDVLEEPVTAVCDMDVAPEASACCFVPLDAFLTEAPSEPLFAYDVYLRQIRYDDGSVWRDPFGLYATEGE